MATVTQDMFTCADAAVTVTFNNATGAIASVNWTVTDGTLTVTIYKTGQQPVVRTVTSDGALSIPNGYNLAKGPKGDWKWLGDPAFEVSWSR